MSTSSFRIISMPRGHLDVPSMKDKVSDAGWAAREDLAALYRAAAHMGFQDITLNHFTVRVPDAPEHFLIKPTEMMFEEVTASSLLCVTLEDKLVYPSPFSKSAASFNIHGTILKRRPDVNCTMHLHSDAGAGISAIEGGLMFISQYAMRFWGKVSYHTYEGLVHGDERAECEVMAGNLGNNNVLILHNHGTLVCGRTVGEAFLFNHYLERAARIQMDVLASGRKVIEPAPEICAEISQGWAENRPNSQIVGDRDWAAVRRQMDRLDPSYLQ
ncbi:MAG: class II aldolase/adducin family protein [Hyphomicrobiaceae bacterium]